MSRVLAMLFGALFVALFGVLLLLYALRNHRAFTGRQRRLSTQEANKMGGKAGFLDY